MSNHRIRFADKPADEESARLAFEAVFLETGRPNDHAWQAVAKKDEPPDYYLRLPNKCYAVEVTSIFDHVDIGSTTCPTALVDAVIRSFVCAVQTQATAAGVLSGQYAIAAHPIPYYASVEARFLETAVAYIVETQHLSSAAAVLRPLATNIEIPWSICKVGDAGAEVTALTTYPAKWGGEADDDLASLFRDCVLGKCEKLQDVSGDKILLIHDRYGYRDEQHWQAAADKAPSVGTFHTVAFTQGDYHCYILGGHGCGEWPRTLSK